MSKRSTLIPKPAEGGKKTYERGLPKPEMNKPGTSAPKNEKPTVKSMTIICEWLSKAIEKLKHATENEQYDFNVTEGRPEKTKKAAENLEAILDRLKRYRNSESEYKKKPLDLDEAKRQQYLEALNSWLEHIGKLFESPNLTFQLNPTVCPPADRMQNIDSQIRELVNKCRKLEDENKKLEDDRRNRQGENSKNDSTQVKELELQLKSYRQGFEKISQMCADKSKDSTTNENGTMQSTRDKKKQTESKLKETIDTGKTIKYVETTILSYANQVKELQKQNEEYSKIIGSINNICKDYDNESSDSAQLPDDEEGPTVKLVQQALRTERQKASEVEGQLKKYTDEIDKIGRMCNDDPKQSSSESTASTENVSDRLRNRIAWLKAEVESCCREIEKITESADEDTVPQETTNSQRRQHSDCVLKIVLDKAKVKVDAITQRLQNETLEKNKYIKAFGFLYDTCQGATASSQRKQKKDEFGKDGKDLDKMVESVTNKITDLTQQLQTETLEKNRCIEALCILHDTCQGVTASPKRKQNKQENAKDIKDLNKLIESVSSGVIDLTEKLNNINNERDVNSGLREKLRKTEESVGELQNRLSKYMGAELRAGNPNVADLSDPNRPTKIAESFHELYDNQWTNAYEELHTVKHKKDTDAIASLLEILQFAFDYCSAVAKHQLQKLEFQIYLPTATFLDKDGKDKAKTPNVDALTKEALTDLRKKTWAASSGNLLQNYEKVMKREKKWDDAYKSEPCQQYISACIQLCWQMVVQSPPVFIDFVDRKKSKPKFNREKYKEYSQSGKQIEFVVWPPLYLHEGGNLLDKGVAQGCK